MSFALPGLLPWRFRIVLIGQQVVLEASSEDQQLSTVLNLVEAAFGVATTWSRLRNVR